MIQMTHSLLMARMYELGPGAQIKAMVKRISPEAWKAMQNVAV